MTLSPEEFVKQLEDSGILAANSFKAMRDAMSSDELPKGTEELAQELVRQRKLTPFQAEKARLGNASSLVLGNYILLEKIGAGGMGQVFKARHRRMDRFVAVKLLPSALTKDAASIARFDREVKAAAKASHPNIVAALDADCADGVHFLVMELVTGSDLSEVVKNDGPFSVQAAVTCILQAAKGLEAAHKQGIVHRDIKPANLVLDSEGTVKILDMGLARLNYSDDEDGPAPADLTNTGTIMGTADYMSPEQAMDTRSADARADIYALGCSLFYLLTGKTTYAGDSLMKKLLAHREQAIPSLCAERPDAPKQLDAVFRKMVAKQVQDRYQTMTEVIAALEDCGELPGTATPIPQPVKRSTRTSQTELTNDGRSLATINCAQIETVTRPPGNEKKIALIATSLLGICVLAVILVSLKTNGGTLIVDVDQPAAAIQVLDAEGKVPRKFFKTAEFDPKTKNVQALPAAKLVEAVTKKFKPVTDINSSDFQKWMQEVTVLPAEEQLAAVVQKLRETNPDFDGKVTHNISGEAVTAFGLNADAVTDLSPVRAFAKLTKLHCRGTGKSKLQDLSPLKGMSLQDVAFSHTSVEDLSPLKGMSLRETAIDNTLVRNLSPLYGMPLTFLAFSNTQISDLSPLRGMPLETIYFHHTPVSDLAPLKGMPLTDLDCDFTQVANLSPLRGMPLSVLYCSWTKVSDLTPLKGLPLQVLTFGSTAVADLSPLARMPLTDLDFEDTKVTDLSPLQHLKLTNIFFSPASITKGMEALRQMKSIRKICRDTDKLHAADDFWKAYDAGEFRKP